MDLNEAKQLVNCHGERIILMEEGNPTMVLLSYAEYKKLTGNAGQEAQQNLFDVPSQEASELQQGPQNELTLEDLPF